MLDINRIRQDPEGVAAALRKRVKDVQFTELLKWDEDVRKVIANEEALRSRRNKVSGEIPQLKKKGEDVSALLAEMKDVGDQIKELEATRASLEEKISAFIDGLPNIPDDDVPAGGKEANKVVRDFGKKPQFSFKPKDHMELAASLGLIDYERGVKLGGNGFWLYTADGARLEWALLNYFIQTHLTSGYTFLLPPHILGYESGYAAGQFPKFIDDVFVLKADEGADDAAHLKFLLPTAETAIINVHRDEILKDEELPKKYFGYTPCYRKEAGSYRASERGMIRGHQFNKIELFSFCRPDESDAIHEEFIRQGEKLMQGLGLHYQVSLLAAEDASAGMAKTYDIEVWIPSMDLYKEVSSASNARDFQARRGNIRYKTPAGKNAFVHTLNASGLATSRLFPAILEQFQQADGSVVVPEPLRSWVGKDRLVP